MPLMLPMSPISGTSSGGPQIGAGPAQSVTVLPAAMTVSVLGSSARSSGDMASGGDSDQGRASLEQRAAALIRRTSQTMSKAAPSSVVGAQIAAEKPTQGTAEEPRLEIHNPFDKVTPPDPLPTAPILRRLSETQE